MYILAIETTGKHASVACIDSQGTVYEETSEESLSHLQKLIPMTDKLLAKIGISAKELTCVAASAGPGSFTGIRIGVSTARALAQALEIPVISVPTLKAFAYNAPDSGHLICPIFDARRNQIYGGGFRWSGDGKIMETVTSGAYKLDEFLDLLKQEIDHNDKKTILFFGDGVESYRRQIEQWQRSSLNDDIRVDFAQSDINLQKASSVARLARKLYEKGAARDFEHLKPVYMRKAEAERKLLRIRSAELADVKEITALDQICFAKPWSEQSFFEEVTKNPIAVYLVAVIDDQIVGYAGLWKIVCEGHITNVAVKPEFRRKGIASALIKALLDHTTEEGIVSYTLEVRVSNLSAISLYKKFAFQECGVRKAYYEDNNEDALIMWKNNKQ